MVGNADAGSAISKPKLSVVMATYNRAETIRTTLRHLAEQELDPADYEVIVVDDGSPDHTRAVVEEWMARAPFRLSYLHHTNHGPGYTQNRGAEIAQAPIVLLMADDIFHQPGSLKAHLQMHLAHPEPEVAVLGRVQQSPALADHPSTFMRKWDPMRFSDFAGLHELPYYMFWACNISVKRAFLMEHGPFREEMGRAGAAAHEDPELGHELAKAGLRILHCPEALGHHYHITTIEDECRRAYVRGVNFVDFRERVGLPEISVAYHVIHRTTLMDHLRVWSSARRNHVLARNRNPAYLLTHYLLRGLAFNSVTVPLFWKPLALRAEHDPAMARLMRDKVYRALFAYHFHRGYREGRGWTGAPAVQTRPA